LELIEAVFLGIVQGLTEFLPISSSGHLVILQHLFGVTGQALDFDVCLHLGTLVAVCIFFRSDLAHIAGALSAPLHTAAAGSPDGGAANEARAEHRRMAFMVVVGSVPTAIVGLLFQRISAVLFSSVILVGVMLLVTGTVLCVTRFAANGYNREGDRRKEAAGLTVLDALVIGTVQGLAIVPGISRSGVTIAAGLMLGLNRRTAAKYSFLLSIPAILGASVLVLGDLTAVRATSPTAMAAGTIVAAIVGYAALKMLVYIVHRGQLFLFAPYCWAAGIVTIYFG